MLLKVTVRASLELLYTTTDFRSYPHLCAKLWRNYTRVIRSMTIVTAVPPRRPPTWALQSIPGIVKPTARFKPTVIKVLFKSAPYFLPRTRIEPKRPKTAPDTPIEYPLNGKKYAEAIEPADNDTKKIAKNFVLPRIDSICVPSECSANILNAK